MNVLVQYDAMRDARHTYDFEEGGQHDFGRQRLPRWSATQRRRRQA
jgi:hypothetical protein